MGSPTEIKIRMVTGMAQYMTVVGDMLGVVVIRHLSMLREGMHR